MVQDFRVAVGQRFGQEIGLFLVVAFQADAVAWFDYGFQQGDDAVRRHLARQILARRPSQATGMALAQAVPGVKRSGSIHEVSFNLGGNRQ